MSINLKELSEAELILLWQGGEDDAFAYIYKKHAVKLLKVALGKTGNREISEEIVQDVFITLFKNKSSAHEIKNIPAYLFAILKNKILDAIRHSMVHQKHESQILYAFNEADNSLIDAIEVKELEQELESQIEKLPPKCRNVYKLSRQSYLRNKEIAALLHISENTVEQHMRKALKILKGTIIPLNKTISVLLSLIILKYS